MNALEKQASGKVYDSLLNYETIKYFNNEMHEGQVYKSMLHKYQDMALKVASSFSVLNFGQNAIFLMGLTLIVYLTLRDVKRGLVTMGDLVLVNGLLFQLSVPLNFIGWVYQELRQSFIDMEAMFKLQDTKPGVVDSSGAVEYIPLRDGTHIKFFNTRFAYEMSPPRLADKITLSDRSTHHAAHKEELIVSRPILKGTSFAIPQGTTIAIALDVKSQPFSKCSIASTTLTGTIRIGNKDIRSFTIESVRRAIAVVLQDVVLFNNSIGYNIHYESECIVGGSY
ncbi:hypothetical protein ACHAW6_004382 [Cyclotella cf. meneghiniana]